MRKRLTISLNEEVYEALYSVVGRGNISRFIENLVRPHVVPIDTTEIAESYRQKAEEEARLGDALYDNEEWEEWDEWYGPNGRPHKVVADADYRARAWFDRLTTNGSR